LSESPAPRSTVPRSRSAVNYGSEALDTVEHLGLILKDQSKARALLQHFGSIANLSKASVHDFLPFLPSAKAAQLVSSLRLAAVALREERSRLVIYTPLAIAELCAEMRFLDRESLRIGASSSNHPRLN
jgi:DNA repair protein RadC